MKHTKKLFAVMALVLCICMLAACAATTDGTPDPAKTPGPTGTPEAPVSTDAGNASNVKAGGTLVMRLAAEPTNLNPNGNYDSENGYIIQNCFNRLLKMNNLQEILPDLAKSYEVSEDGLTYTFHLYENVNFHDGTKLTSDDVKFTFDQIIAQGGVASFALGSLASVECPDENTVVMTTSAVDASFLYNIAYQGTYILPRHAYEGKDWLGADALQTPIGTGPFVFDNWERGVSLVLTRNADYFMGPELPYLDKVIFGFNADGTTAKAAFLAGEYDILGAAASTDITEYRANENLVLEVNMYPSRFMVAFNLREEPFSNLALRQAISYAIDKDEMLNIALKDVGMIAEYYVSPLFGWAVNENAPVPGYDLDKALSYMEQTGLTKDAGGFYLRVTLDTMNYSPFPDLAQVFKSQMAKIGIDVTINMLEYASYDEKVVKNHNFSIGLTSDYQGPEISAIGNTIGSTGYMNVMGFNNAEIDDLLVQAVGVVTFEKRASFYQRIQEIMLENQPYYVISEWVGFYPHWGYVQGHPGSEEALGLTGYGEFTYVWLDKE